MREALLLAAAMATTAPAWGHWTAFGEDGRNAVWYVDPASVRTVGELRQVWAMKDMAQPVIDFDLSMQFLYEVDC